MARILIIDGDPAFRDTLGAIVTGLGHHADHAATLAEAMAPAPTPARGTDIIFLNARLEDGSGLDALPRLRNSPGKPEIIIVTDAATPDGAERAIRNGAWEYLPKQGTVDRMVLPLLRALEYRGRKPSKREEVRLKRDSIIGNGAGITRCLNIVSEAAASDASALLYGETGVGKEVFARAIHENSQRHSGPFVAVDCASLSRTLAGSTLFGHRKGAFTGADKDRDGLVAQAHRGTLFLDEVGELPLAMQKIFLRVLQEHRFRPVGGRAEITSDFRLICATNRNLEEMVSRGTFRSDLLFRMRTVVMHIPPLRERTEDLPELAEHYTRRICGKYGMPMKSLSTDLQAALREYLWPGNVRELIHTLERAVLAAQDDPKLFSRHLPDHVRISIARAAASDAEALSPSARPAQPADLSPSATVRSSFAPPPADFRSAAPYPLQDDLRPLPGRSGPSGPAAPAGPIASAASWAAPAAPVHSANAASSTHLTGSTGLAGSTGSVGSVGSTGSAGSTGLAGSAGSPGAAHTAHAAHTTGPATTDTTNTADTAERGAPETPATYGISEPYRPATPHAPQMPHSAPRPGGTDSFSPPHHPDETRSFGSSRHPDETRPFSSSRHPDEASAFATPLRPDEADSFAPPHRSGATSAYTPPRRPDEASAYTVPLRPDEADSFTPTRRPDEADSFTPPLRPGASCRLGDSMEDETASGYPNLQHAAISSHTRHFPWETAAQSAIADNHATSKSAIPDNRPAAPRQPATVPPLHDHSAPPSSGSLPPFFQFRDTVFTAYLTQLMDTAQGDIATACTLSGLSRSHLYDLLKKHGVPTTRKRHK